MSFDAKRSAWLRQMLGTARLTDSQGGPANVSKDAAPMFQAAVAVMPTTSPVAYAQHLPGDMLIKPEAAI